MRRGENVEPTIRRFEPCLSGWLTMMFFTEKLRGMKVSCSIEETSLQGDYGDVEGVCATCSRCGHTTESFGTGDGSRRRCLMLMRENCPEGESNFYEEE